MPGTVMHRAAVHGHCDVDPGSPLRGPSPMTTPFLLHDLVFASAARRPQAPALVAGRNTLDYGELASRVQTFAAGLCKLGLARGDRVGDLARQAVRDRGRRLRRRRRGVRVRAAQSAAEAAAGRLHPARLQRAVARDVGRTPGARRRRARAMCGLPARGLRRRRRRHVVTGHCAACIRRRRRRRDVAHAPRDRHRHAGDPLHLRQHRQAQGRRAVPSQHGGGRQERRVVSRQ